jgi:hypothetical protein
MHQYFKIFYVLQQELLSCFYFINQWYIFNLLPIPSRAKYLGIPLFMNRNKRDAFIDIKDKIFTKVSGWKDKLLSQAARTTLLTSVANAIPTYLMSLFLLPKSLCSEITAAMRKFW